MGVAAVSSSWRVPACRRPLLSGEPGRCDAAWPSQSPEADAGERGGVVAQRDSDLPVARPFHSPVNLIPPQHNSGGLGGLGLRARDRPRDRRLSLHSDRGNDRRCRGGHGSAHRPVRGMALGCRTVEPCAGFCVPTLAEASTEIVGMAHPTGRSCLCGLVLGHRIGKRSALHAFVL